MNYEHIYFSIIEKRKQQILVRENGYCEYHHIKPVSVYPELANAQSNIIALTAREHYVAHRLLVKIYEQQYGKDSKEYRSMLNALWYISHTAKHKKFVTSREYQVLKEHFSQMLTESKSGKNHWHYGGKNSEETRKKISEANKGNTWTEERKIKYGKEHSGKNNPNYGHKWTDEQKHAMSLKKKGCIPSKELRQKLSQKFSGSGNPMYGKSSWDKCSLEERANRIARWQKSMKGKPKGSKGAKWMYDPNTLKSCYVKASLIQEYLNNGYKIGRKFNNPWSKENRHKK